MNTLEAIFLGFLQGFTEFLPISSSGHLVLAESLLGTPFESLAFNIILHSATFLAIILFFWRELWELFTGTVTFKKKPLQKTGKLIFATLPVVFITLLVKDNLTTLDTPLIVGIGFLFSAILLFAAQKLSRKTKSSKETDPNTFQNLTMGIFQAIAIIPGISRSGVTLSAGLLSKYEKNSALHWSFLMSLPTIFGATILSLFDDQLFASLTLISPIALTAGFIAAFIGAILSIKFMIFYVQKLSLNWFSAYLLIAGIFALSF